MQTKNAMSNKTFYRIILTISPNYLTPEVLYHNHISLSSPIARVRQPYLLKNNFYSTIKIISEQHL